MKSVYDMMTKRKVVEPNKMTGLRIGHMLAQQILTENEWYGDVNAGRAEHVIDNGFVLFQDVDGYIKKPGNVADAVKAAGHVYLHFTEEKQGGYSNYLAHYTTHFTTDEDEGNGYIAYPRMIALYSGDIFTTDNFTGTLAGAAYATVGTDGQIALSGSLPTGYTGPLFRVAAETTLPDGVTAAAQLEVIATVYVA